MPSAKLSVSVLLLAAAMLVVSSVSAQQVQEADYFLPYLKKGGPQGPLRFGKRRGPSGPLRFGKRSSSSEPMLDTIPENEFKYLYYF